MRPSTDRPFRISDAIVLVAATGVGLAGCRGFFSAARMGWTDVWPSEIVSLPVRIWHAALGAVPVGYILLLSWTIAVVWLRLRPPCPHRRRLWSQPGFVSCVAAVFAFAWNGAGVGFRFAYDLATVSPAQRATIKLDEVLQYVVSMLSYHVASQSAVGGSIVLVWLVTWASGRCRPEASWVDRAGRFLGAAWIAVTLISLSAAFAR